MHFVPNIYVKGVNLANNPVAFNAAPVLAITLMMHAMERKTGAKVKGVAVIHHEAHFQGKFANGRFIFSQPKTATNLLGNLKQKPNAIALQPVAQGNLSLSLLIAYEGDQPESAAVTEFFQTARLAGGDVMSFNPIEALNNEQWKARSKNLNGYWIVDRTEEVLSADDDPIISMNKAITDMERRFVPTALGYALLSQPMRRDGAREGYPHAFCESLVGLIEYMDLERWRTDPPFWSAGWKQDDVFLATTSKLN
jgi:CRISPR-associated protein Csy2